MDHSTRAHSGDMLAGPLASLWTRQELGDARGLGT